MGQSWQKLTIVLVGLGVTFAQPGWSDVPPAPVPIYSEAFCLKIFEEVVEKARSSTWKISDRDRHILTQCRTKFPQKVNTQIALPNASECVYVVQTLVRGGLSKVKEIELPEEQVKSIERCDEVIQYHQLASANMQPTLKFNDRIVFDKLVYQKQSPQRGDIIVFKPPTSPQSDNPPELSTQRIVGLPTEKVKIKNSKIYINGKFLNENYLTQSEKHWHESVIVPTNNYLVLDDNRYDYASTPTWKLVPRSAILGKVIWHFGSK